uniref:Uncharacterized protein n=1 Tax=Knipowitschia caucasica TaxID=637954 RepID=A0AAV2KM26_KNICA
MSGAKGPPLGAGGVASGASGARRRRTRCRRCQACLRTECGECHFCKDMKKFGGPGRMKQSCLLRQCTAPVLPHTAVCLACGEAGKEDTVDDPDDKFSLCLMECTICNEIIHPSCLKMGKAEGIINDEIPNCWECPKCHKEGKTSKDQTDGSGKRRLDNGEVGRWKITDEPPPKKKALPAGDEVSRSDSRGGEGRAEGRAEGRSNESRAEGRSNEGHKRKKDKEPAPDAKKKIKGNHEKRLKKKPKPEENGSGSGGGAQGSGAGASSVGTSGSGSSNQDQRSHQREKLERFKRMCLLERRLSSSSSSSSSESDSSDSDSDSANHRAGSPPSSPFSPAHRERKYSERERERERDRRLAELGFSASDESDDPTRAEDPEEREEPKRRGEGLTLKRKTMETDEDEEERRDRKSSLPSPLSSNQMSASGPHDVFVPKQRNNGADSRNGRRNNVVGGEKENASTNHRHGTAPGAGAKTGARSRSKLRSKPSGSGARLGSAPSLPSSNGSSAVSLPLPRCRPPAPPCPPRPPRPLERHLVKPPPHCPEPSLLPLTTGHAHILHRDTWVRVFAHLSHRELCVCMRVCRTWSRWYVTSSSCVHLLLMCSPPPHVLSPPHVFTSSSRPVSSSCVHLLLMCSPPPHVFIPPHVLTSSSCLHLLLMSSPPPHVLTSSSCPHLLLRSSPPPHVFTSSSGPHLLLMSSPPPHVFTSSSCLHLLLMSSPPPHVLTSSSCLHLLLMSSPPPHVLTSPPPHVLTSSSCPHLLLMSSPPPHVLTSSSCLHLLLMSSPPPHVLTSSSCPHLLLRSSPPPVCRCCDKRLWSHIDLSRQRSITAPMLSGIIRRQPVSLNLGSTNISKKQLMWLLNRLQGLEQLFLPGCLWSSVSALCLTVCPGLRLLDLSRVEELKDSQLKELLAPPTELRSAHGDCRGGRFQGVTELRLAGLEVTDAATRLLLRYTPHLQRLDLSHCPLLSDQGIATLTSGLCPLRLGHLGLAGCVRLSEQAVALLRRCSSLQTVDLRSCMQLSAETAQLLHFPSSSAACTASAPPTSCPLLKNS